MKKGRSMARITQAALRRQFLALEKSENPTRRGYALQRLVLQLLQLEGADASGGFRPQGEEIDGFFSMDHRFFHVECKWEATEIPASAIYSFRGKFEGKLLGTMGVFVSMSGYSSNVAEVLRYGKTIDVVLFNADDVRYALSSKNTFTKIIRIKLRRAAQYGEPYYPFQTYLDEHRD
jgi:hypothetical protein